MLCTIRIAKQKNDCGRLIQVKLTPVNKKMTAVEKNIIVLKISLLELASGHIYGLTGIHEPAL